MEEFVHHAVSFGLVAPVYHFRDSACLRVLLLKHSAKVEDGVGDIEAGPGNHVEAGVPEPLIGTVFVESRSIEMVLHSPSFSFQEIIAKGFLNFFDEKELICLQLDSCCKR